MFTICQHKAQRGIALILAVCLVVACVPVIFAQRAWGELSLEEAQAALASAEDQMGSITEEYLQIKAESDAIAAQIAETTSQAMEAQQLIIEGRQALGELAKYEYRLGAVSIWMILLAAQDFREFQQNLNYLDSIQQRRADMLVEQRKRAEEFDELLAELNKQQDAQDEKLAEMQAKRAQAAQVLAGATGQLQEAQDFEAIRLAALEQQAAALEENPEEPVLDDSWNTNPDGVDTEIGTPSPNEEAPTPEPPASWSTGIASAYGGSSDPYTPNPGITATGAICDDWSMGVAVPMSWPNYRSYFGRAVQIQYGGMTVLATVNDCGYMGGGSRSLDLQPGVFKAFGFGDCYAWGVREVSYRFL